MIIFLYLVFLAGAVFAYCFGVGLKTLEQDFKRGRNFGSKRREEKTVADEQKAKEWSQSGILATGAAEQYDTDAGRSAAEQEERTGDWIGAATLGVLYLTFCAAVAAAWEGDRLAELTREAISHADTSGDTQHADTVAVIAKAGEANRNAKDFADRQILEMQNANAITKSVADAANKSSEAALKQAEALRGNARYGGIRFDQIIANGDFSVDPEKFIGWNLTPSWQNVGGTDIRDFIGWWKIFPVIRAAPISIVDAMQLRCPEFKKPDVQFHSATISPGATHLMVAQPLSIDDAIRAASPEVIELIYVVIHVEYNDIFADSKLHHYDWCNLMYPNDIPNGVFSPYIIEDRSWE
jgi:hypothetical protein